MKLVLCVIGVVLSFVCGANIAIAFTPGVPPLSGPGSVFHGNPDVAPRAQVQKSKSKQKSQASRSRVRQALPKQSQ